MRTAIKNAVEFLESLGYTEGDVHNELVAAGDLADDIIKAIAQATHEIDVIRRTLRPGLEPRRRTVAVRNMLRDLQGRVAQLDEFGLENPGDSTTPATCFECRQGEHDDLDDDVRMTLVTDPENGNRIVRRARLCGMHRETALDDGYRVKILR